MSPVLTLGGLNCETTRRMKSHESVGRATHIRHTEAKLTALDSLDEDIGGMFRIVIDRMICSGSGYVDVVVVTSLAINS